MLPLLLDVSLFYHSLKHHIVLGYSGLCSCVLDTCCSRAVGVGYSGIWSVFYEIILYIGRLLFSLKIHLFLSYVYESLLVRICTMFMPGAHKGQKRALEAPGTELTDGHECHRNADNRTQVLF